MNYRFLGRTGILVSELALGTNTFGGTSATWKGFGALGRPEATAVVREALEAGVNLIDTAESYGDGESEVRVGDALKDLNWPRQDVVIATKVFGRGPGKNSYGASRNHILNAVEASLKCLRTDYIDLYMLHHFDPHTPLDETLQAFDLLVRQGKVRFIGCSNLYAWQMAVAIGISERCALPRFEAMEAMYTVAARDIERELVGAIRHHQVGLLVWGALAGGLLTGKYAGAAPAEGRLAATTSISSRNVDREAASRAIEAMRPIAEQRGTSIAEVAIAWLLRKEWVTTVIVGARRPEQFRQNLGALALELSDAELALLDEVARPRPEYPAWHQDATNRLRFAGHSA